MIQYNIYYGTIGKTLGVCYRYTKWCKNEQEALKIAETAASSLFYKNEGKHGLPSYVQISKDSKITGIDIENMYKDYINYYMQWYAIPTEIDSVPNKKLKY